jgi:hypothetical protein
MDFIDEIKERIKKKNKILFSKNGIYLHDLQDLMDAQNHQTLVLWAFEFAEETIRNLEKKYPHEKRPKKALETTKLWASGKVKMAIAKREILNCHAFAKEINSNEDIALCHAIGQACSVVHTSGHAMGFPFYDLTAIVYKLGIDKCRDDIENRKKQYIDRINYWKNHYKDYTGEWADFMLRN